MATTKVYISSIESCRFSQILCSRNSENNLSSKLFQLQYTCSVPHGKEGQWKVVFLDLYLLRTSILFFLLLCLLRINNSPDNVSDKNTKMNAFETE